VPIADIGLRGLYVCFGGKADIARTCGLSATVGASSSDRPGVRIGRDFGGQIEIAARSRRPAIATYVLVDELLAKEQVGPQFTPCARDKKELQRS
jgi:hypothetical protein